MIAESVALPRGRRASASSTTPSTSSTAARDDRDYALRLPARSGRRGRRERRALRHQRLLAAAARSPRRPSPSSPRSASTSRVGIHCHDDAGCGVANSLAAVEAGATQVQGTINGIGERTGNANLVTIIANLQLKMGRRVLAAGAARAPDRDRALRRRAPQPRAEPARSRTSGENAFAHKGGMHVAGVRADAATFEHVDPSLVGNRRELLISELAGRGTVAERAPAAGLDLDDAAAARVVERVKELEHGGYQFEAADGSFELLMRRRPGDYEPLFRLESWRVIVEQRADGKVETEATIKIWVDGERYVRTAEGNGPVNALDARAARGASARSTRTWRTSSSSTSRSASSTRRTGTGAITRVLHRRLRRRRRLGLDRRRRERHRRLLGGARRLARVRRAAGAQRRTAGRGDARRRGVKTATDVIPLAQPVLGRDGGGGGDRGPALGPALARPARARRSSRPSRRGSARAHASAVSSGTAGLHLALRAVGVGRRRRGRHVAVLVRRQRQRLLSRARPPGLRRHRPA